ncbi:hypothetical protein [Nocardia sp. CDC160]|uniref:hypothetical protein n=1 Tax=Nocardia sp. CDC160 TaxID=3112166 RepID=UPI002DB78E41|nr:hypothetical protein [Nocardia sp. CDC160]MEC3919356.1 hypothetical protein [Nocardia sp. CDC160]
MAWRTGSRARGSVLGVMAFAVGIAGGGVVPGVAPSSRAEEPGRVEVPVETRGDVSVSEVTWDAPLPAGSAPHPAACDRLSFLRFRFTDGPADSADADAVISAQPGNIGGPSSMSTLAISTLHKLRAAGKTAEYWSMARRPVCMEDRSAMVAANRARDYHVALDYYFGGKAVDGQTFSGWADNSQQRWLGDYGLRQTIEDWHFINSHEMPLVADRKAKMFISGHSLGGPLSSDYGQWDFADGPGFAQTAGVIGVDGPIRSDPFLTNQLGLRGLADVYGMIGMPVADAVLRSGIAPESTQFGIANTGDLFNLIAVAGIAARYQPDAESDIPRAIPHTPFWDLVLGTLFPGGPDFRDWRLTNAAVLGALIGKNSMPSVGVQAGFGIFDGPLVEKRVIIPPELTRIPVVGPFFAVVSAHRLARPADPTGRLNGWLNYDELDRADNGGAPYTTPGEQVTDLADIAADVGAGPLGYTTAYDSNRQLSDMVFAGIGDRTGDLAQLRYTDYLDHVPNTTIIGDIWHPYQNLGPALGLPWLEFGQPASAIYAQNYSHLDMIAGAERQNDGQPETVSRTSADFVLGVLGR